MIQVVIFDLDGVLVDTAKYHFICWQRLASSLGISIDEEFNQELKGVSRMDSLDMILALGGIEKTDEEKLELADTKNKWYLRCLNELSSEDLLEGVEETLLELKSREFKIGLGSASQSGEYVIKKLGIYDLFDAVVDGNGFQKSKPDPEVFLTGAQKLGVAPAECAVLEDAPSGILAAIAGGMLAIGVGSEPLPGEDHHLNDLSNPLSLIALL
ncbi:beta-phosphoglucomutase [Salibacteraceae bacterium]|jgi:beta-phosphoglucomutase|nr:beta-phosphoglucomutase [Salibacteraceae bacterium]